MMPMLAIAAVGVGLVARSAVAQGKPGVDAAAIISDAFETTCFNQGSFQSPSAASCSNRVTGGAASASASANFTTRTIAGTQSVAQDGGPGSSFTQTETTSRLRTTIFVHGTAGSPDNLVFHFFQIFSPPSFVNGKGGTGPGGASQSSFGVSVVGVQAGNDSIYTAFEDRYANADETSGSRLSSNATVSAAGTSGQFILPFSATGGDYGFQFVGTADGLLTDQPMGATEQSSFQAMLDSVDAVNSQGQTVGQVVFDTQGNAVLDLNGGVTTTPEPSSIALLGTGLAGLVPMLRRRRKV